MTGILNTSGEFLFATEIKKDQVIHYYKNHKDAAAFIARLDSLGQRLGVTVDAIVLSNCRSASGGGCTGGCSGGGLCPASFFATPDGYILTCVCL